MAREIHVTSPMMRGEDVLDVQQRLAAWGFSPGPLDGAYGAGTAAAVRAFQLVHGLVADGSVSAHTFEVLCSAAAGSTRPVVDNGLGQAALTEALKHLGVTEAPAGSNNTAFGAWFGRNGVPWCNIFVSYCYSVGAGYTICEGLKGAGVQAGKGCAYVPTTSAWLQASGLWVGRSEPQPGDIAIFNWDGGRPDHIGIVETWLGNGELTTIEGNTAVGNDSNGGQVMRRRRQLVHVDGFGRVTKTI